MSVSAEPKLVVDEAHPGTLESVWIESGHLDTTPPMVLRPWRRAVIVAPHPDDEVLGAGGLIQGLVEAGIPTRIVAVTD